MNDLLNTLIKALGQSCQLEDDKKRKRITRDLGSLLTSHFKSKEVKKAVSKALDIAKGVPGATKPEPKAAAEGGLVDWQRGKKQSQAQPSPTSIPGSVVNEEDNNDGLIDATKEKGEGSLDHIASKLDEIAEGIKGNPGPGVGEDEEEGDSKPKGHESIEDLQKIATLANDEVINHFGGISKVKKFAKAQGFTTKQSLGGDTYLDAFRAEVMALLAKIGGGKTEEE